MRRQRHTAALVGASALLIAACGGEEPQKERLPRADAAARPPPGWRTVVDRRAGFTISVPKRWAASLKGKALLIRSQDRLVVITATADRGPAGRKTPPSEYARETVDRLPEFEGQVRPGARRVRGAPYPSARVEAVGQISTTRRAQRITVAAFHRPDVVTYVAVVFRNARAAPAAAERDIDRVLGSLRAGAPE